MLQNYLLRLPNPSNPKPFKLQTLQTPNPSNPKPFKLQTLQTSNPSNLKPFKPFNPQTLFVLVSSHNGKFYTESSLNAF